MEPSRVFTLKFGAPGETNGEARMTSSSYVAFRTIRDEVASLKAAAFQRLAATVFINGDQRNISAMLVSGNYFEVLAVRPSLGSAIPAAADEPGAVPVVWLSHAFWQSVLAADQKALGRSLKVDGLPYTVAGVMPEGFSGHSTTRIDLWIPFAAAMRNTPGWDNGRRRRSRRGSW